MQFRRVLIPLFLIVILCVAPFPAFAQQTKPPVARPAANQSDAARRLETFEIVWKTVNQSFFDPKFGGVDWQAVHERYAPLMARVNSDDELHLLLQQMVNELHQSHFFVIPPRAIPKLLSSDESDDSGLSESEAPGDAAARAETTLERIRTRLTRRLSTGIGIDLRLIDGMAVITRVAPDSTAARAGLRAGFGIRSANGIELGKAVLDIERDPIWHEIIRPEIPELLIARYINGELNSPVNLVYLDGANHEHSVTLLRQRLDGEMSPAIGNLPPMYTEFESRQLSGSIGYIRFNAFSPLLMKKVCAALRSMHDAPGMILDLRGNHGGLLGMIAGLRGLLEANRVVLGSMQTRQGFNPMLAYSQRLPYLGPIAVLLDGTSQSAAEMFAAGLQEDHRAIVVGETTAGNVIPSAIIKLPTGALLQYGFAKFLTPLGRVLESHGVTPDWTISPTRAGLLADGDLQLSFGIRKVQEEIAARKRPPELVGKVTVHAPRYGDPKTVTTISEPPPPPPKPVPAKPTVNDPAASPDSPSPQQIIEKYIAAVGGEKALLNLTSRVSTGTVELAAMGVMGKAEVYEMAPNKSALVMKLEGLGIIRQTSDGVTQRVQDPLAGLMTFPLPATEQSLDRFHQEIAIEKLASSLRFDGRIKVGDKDAFVLSHKLPSGFVDKLFFDANSGLLLRRNSVYYEDYREIDGVKVPFTTRTESPYGSVVLRMSEIKHNVPIDQSNFVETPDCFSAPNGNGEKPNR